MEHLRMQMRPISNPARTAQRQVRFAPVIAFREIHRNRPFT